MSPSSDPGPPPVRTVQRSDDALEKYQQIVAVFKSNNGADAKAIRAALGGDKQLMDRFLAVTFSALASDSKILRDASVMSLVQTVKDAAALGLEPMSQDAAIVVYGGQAKLMVQWRGYVKRIRNSRAVLDLDCQIVYKNDRFELELGTNPSILHIPAMQDRGDYLGAYAWALMPSGKYIIEYMPVADINEIRDRYGNKRSSNGAPLPWETAWSEMARKTVIRRLAKRLPAAAVDALLTIEHQNDEALEAIRVSQREHSDELSEVRNLALRAVGALPALEAGEETPSSSDQQQSIETEARAQEIVAEDDAAIAAFREEVDPNVAAAMRLAEEQEQLRRQRARR